MSRSRRVLWTVALVALVCAVAAGGYAAARYWRRGGTDRARCVEASADALYDAFEANEVAATDAYGGEHSVCVLGVVSVVQVSHEPETAGTMYVGFATVAPGHWVFANVSRDAGDEQRRRVGQLRAGSPVRMRCGPARWRVAADDSETGVLLGDCAVE